MAKTWRPRRKNGLLVNRENGRGTDDSARRQAESSHDDDDILGDLADSEAASYLENEIRVPRGWSLVGQNRHAGEEEEGEIQRL